MNSIPYLLSTIIFKILHPRRIKNVSIGKNSNVGNGSHLINCSIGNFTYLAYNTRCYNMTIGNFCSVGNNCVIGGAEHPISMVSTSPVFYDKHNPCKVKLGNLIWNSYSKRTTIGNDVWIGDGALLKAGINIGNGSIIGMGSVVTKDIPDFEIWAGNPAHFIKKRFPDEVAEKIMRIEWWNYGKEKIISLNDCLDNPRIFIDKIKELKK